MPLPRPLDPVEIRVLGALLEKQQTTPEYYPLTLKALLAACNQKSNRDPVTELGEGELAAALDRLHAEMLVWPSEGTRVRRWEHTLDRRLSLEPRAKALLTVLLLRGAQTPGELRSRTERMATWSSLAEIEETLRAMASGPDALTAELDRQPGQKEVRWAHTAGGRPTEASAPAAGASSLPSAEPLATRVARLEKSVATLGAHLAELLDRLARE